MPPCSWMAASVSSLSVFVALLFALRILGRCWMICARFIRACLAAAMRTGLSGESALKFRSPAPFGLASCSAEVS